MSDRYIIDGDSFQAEFFLSPVTHKVTEAAPLIQWMVGFDRFQVFRVVARRGWRIATTNNILTNERPTQRIQSHFQAAHAEPLPSEDVDPCGTSL